MGDGAAAMRSPASPSPLDRPAALTRNDTTILKFFLHISPEEQLSRFKLDDPSRYWKISESDYSEREL